MHKTHIPVNICVASIIILTQVWYSCTSMYIPRILSRRDGVSSTLTGGRSVVKNSLTIHTLPSLSYTCISCSCVTYLGALTHLACMVWYLPPISSDLVLYQLLHSLFLLPTPPPSLPTLPHPSPTPPCPSPTLYFLTPPICHFSLPIFSISTWRRTGLRTHLLGRGTLMCCTSCWLELMGSSSQTST